MTDSFMKRYGARLVDNGYSIIPIMPGTKKPGRWTGSAWVDFTGWQQFASTPPTQYHIALWETWPDCGIGILCRNLAGVDVDILDRDVAAKVVDIITDHLGETPAVRIGKAPKMLLVYQPAESFKKIQMHPIECLADGQQFVGYALHPDTGLPYEWPLDSLVDIPIERLPVVTEAQMRKAMEAAYAVIPEHLKPRRPLTLVADNEPHVSSDLEGTPEAIAECIARIPNEDLGWDDWNRVGMALYASSGGRAFKLFDEWSMRSPQKYQPNETLKRWNSYSRSRPTMIGMGTLIHLAQQFGDTPIPSDVPFNESKRLADDYDISQLVVSTPPLPKPKRADAPPAEQVALTQEMRDSFPVAWMETDSLVGQITRWIVSCALYQHPPLALANALALMGALCGRRYRLVGQKTDFDTRANVFTVGIAGTASGKDHSRKCVSKILRKAGLFQAFSGGGKFTSDASIEGMLGGHPSKICAIDELGVFLQAMRHKNSSSSLQSVMSILLEIFSSSGGTYSGKEYADKKTKPRIDVVFPNFNFYGTTTPESLIPALSRELVENGLLNRMLFFPPFEVYPYPKDTQAKTEPPDAIIEAVRNIVRAAPAGAGNLVLEQISSLEPELMEVMFGNGVEDSLAPIRNKQTDLMRCGRLIWGRSAEYTMKIAMLEAIARNPLEPVITNDILVMSYQLVEWSIRFMEGLVSEEIAENEADARAKQILKAIRKAGAKGITAGELSNITSIRRRDRKEIIDDLAESGKIVVEKSPTRGAPLVRYRSTG